jgi:hypothetical protein
MQAVGYISHDRCQLPGPELVDDCGSRFELAPGSSIDDEIPAGPRQLGGNGMTEPT